MGGAIALYLLFGLPLPLGAVIVGGVSMLLLAVQARNRQRPFEFIIIFLLGIITIGFLAGLFISPPDPAGVLAGLIPGFQGPDTVLLAASMLGATVMPHAIYVHSALSRDRHRPDPHLHVPVPAMARLVKATRLDVVAALAIAGLVNIGMLLLAASTLGGEDGHRHHRGRARRHYRQPGPDRRRRSSRSGCSPPAWHPPRWAAMPAAPSCRACSRSGSRCMTRRVVTLIPAVVLLAVGFDPTWALVLSQVVLSFGIPFVLVPLVVLTSNKDPDGPLRRRPGPARSPPSSAWCSSWP